MAKKKYPRATPQFWQTVKDSADFYSRNKRLGEGVDPIHKVLPTDLVKVRNNTGANRRQGEVLEVGTKLLDTLTNEYLWFEGKEPSGTIKFGILRKPLPDGQITGPGGELQVSGVCQAWIDVQNADDPRAEVIVGSHVLRSELSGPYKILWNPPGETGEQLCVVVLDGGGAVGGSGSEGSEESGSSESGSEGSESGPSGPLGDCVEVLKNVTVQCVDGSIVVTKTFENVSRGNCPSIAGSGSE